MYSRLFHTRFAPHLLVGLLHLLTGSLSLPAQGQTESDTIVVEAAVPLDDSAFLLEKNPQPITVVHQRRLPDSVIRSLKSQDAFWYADKAPERQQQKSQPAPVQKKPFFLQPWFKVLLWIIIIGSVVAVFIWFLAVSNIRLFRKPPQPLPVEDAELLEEDIFSIAYEQQMQKALGEQNYRLVVRLLYLQTLTLLSNRNIIQYKTGRTNSDYLMQLSGSRYYQQFFRLTRDFEYTWYGQFALSEAAFRTIEADFRNFQQNLPSS